MPKIDDDIDTVIGLAVFYQYVLSATLNQPQTQHVSVFTTELFAHYVNTRIIFESVMEYPSTRTSSYDRPIDLQRYVKCISEIHHPFISDIILYKSLISALKSAICSTMELVKCCRFDRFVASETEMNTAQKWRFVSVYTTAEVYS